MIHGCLFLLVMKEWVESFKSFDMNNLLDILFQAQLTEIKIFVYLMLSFIGK